MKKLTFVFVLFIMMFLTVTPVMAENEDFANNESYYIQMCSVSDLSEEDEAICKEFQIYMTEQSSELQRQIDEIDAQMEEIVANIAKEAEKIREYEAQIEELNVQINELDQRIEELSIQIEEKKQQIEANEKEVEYLQEKLKERMVSDQPTMRLNVMIDFLMGADTFEDFLRRAAGLNAINSYEEQVRLDLLDLLEQLEKDRQELSDNQLQLEADKAELVEAYNEVQTLKYKSKLITEEFKNQQAELEAMSNQISGDLEELRAMQKELAEKLGSIVSSSGFMRPITDGRISATTWFYPESFGGGLHLGTDYADSSGTPVYAPANGVVVASVDGCGVGWLGNQCGGAQGGLNMGGNQLYLVVSVDGKTYGLRYFHFLYGTVVPTGTVINQGDKIAEIGSSGNSTGPHTHVEVIYLGTMSVQEYVEDWNGSLSFNASYGWNAYYNYRCETGASAPCRIQPESVFE